MFQVSKTSEFYDLVLINPMDLQVHIKCCSGPANFFCHFPAVTPDGRGDAIVDGPDGSPCFVTPLEERVPFSTFLKALCSTERSTKAEVPYASHQNGSFLTEYGPLAEDAETEIPWASRAFGEDSHVVFSKTGS